MIWGWLSGCSQVGLGVRPAGLRCAITVSRGFRHYLLAAFLWRGGELDGARVCATCAVQD